jgi:hypothetical protein
MENAGIVPEEDEIQEGETLDEATPPKESEARLSVFEDFLDQLDLDDQDDEEED